jgi:hypothetical protein
MPGTSNSGRNNRSAIKHEELQRLSLTTLRKRKLLSPGRSGSITWSCNERLTGLANFSMVDRYSSKISFPLPSGEWRHETIAHSFTPTNFGGWRLWFACPRCSKACGTLYRAHGRYVCRQCLRLTYASQYDRQHERPRRKAIKIRARLGQSTQAPDGEAFPPKPPRMRWATYRRLKAEDRKHCRDYDGAWGEWAIGIFAAAFARTRPQAS